MSAPTEPETTTVAVDRAAIRRLIAITMACIVTVALAAGTITLMIALGRISELEAGLAERRAVRDQQMRDTQQIVCTVLGHVNNPTAPDLQNIRDQYQCPTTPPPTN